MAQDDRQTGEDSAKLQQDFDPAAPQGDDERSGDLAAAIALSNGALDKDASFAEAAALAPRPTTPPTIDLDWDRVAAFYTACITSTPRVTYGLGAKIPNDTSRPGIDFKRVDCSGFIRAVIRRATSPAFPFPDGSVQQHDWVAAQGFPKLPLASGTLADDKIRIAFLSPSDSPQRIGHVVLIHNGHTVESHGGVGPDRRPWTMAGWQAKATVYLLDES